jgi:hypothetical protein
MRHLLVVCLALFVSLATLLYPIQAAGAASQFAGEWEGKMNGLPAVELALRDDGGKVTGTIAFYFQELGEDGKWRVVGDKTAQPLIGPQVEGNILTFEVLHHKTHGSSELGPNMRFRFEVTGANEAYIHEAGDSSDAPRHRMKLTHRE